MLIRNSRKRKCYVSPFPKPLPLYSPSMSEASRLAKQGRGHRISICIALDQGSRLVPRRVVFYDLSAKMHDISVKIKRVCWLLGLRICQQSRNYEAFQGSYGTDIREKCLLGEIPWSSAQRTHRRDLPSGSMLADLTRSGLPNDNHP